MRVNATSYCHSGGKAERDMSLEIKRGNYTVVPSPGVPGVWSNGVPPQNLKWLLCQAELFTQKALRCSSGFS